MIIIGKTYEFGASVDKSDEKQTRRMQLPFVYRMDVDLAIARSGVIVDALLLMQQKCIDDTTFAMQSRLQFSIL